MKILCATDGSTYSEMAARTLVALGPPASAEIVVLHVIEPPQYWVTPAVPPSYQPEWDRVQQELRQEASEASEQAIARTEQLLKPTGAVIRPTVREGHPANEIVSAAKEIGADLVVVGSKGLTDSMLFLLGSVSQKVVKYAPCSVLLAKSGEHTKEPTVGRIVIATDGSKDAEDASRFLSSFRLTNNTQVTVLHVVQQARGFRLSASAAEVLEQVRQSRLEHAERSIRTMQERLATKAATVTAIREGDPAEQILETSSEAEADLIVVGSKGLSGIKLFLLGSVSQRVCRHSDRSVLLVRMRNEPGSISEERS